MAPSALVLAAALMLSAAPAHASAVALRWDATGHRAMAAIAYDRLRPATRARVDSLLRAHPDFVRLSEGVDAATPSGIREVFLRASIWADRIRSDARFYRENVRSPQPTPLLPGFPSMERHEEWHYLTRSFSTDGSPTISLAEPNAASVMPDLADAMADPARPAALRAYNLVWIIHIVGDLHQPLHGTSRSTRERPQGDAGGNGVFVRFPGDSRDSSNLHWVWDGWVGRASRDMRLDDIARQLAAQLPIASPEETDALAIPDGAALATTVLRWADESATIARYMAYELPPRVDARPPLLPPEYLASGEAIARQRLALSAYRLAALLEARLGD
jgi:hypothetical protein